MGIGNLCLGVYLLLVGFVLLLEIPVAPWVLGLLAVIAGLALLLEGFGQAPWKRN